MAGRPQTCFVLCTPQHPGTRHPSHTVLFTVTWSLVSAKPHCTVPIYPFAADESVVAPPRPVTSDLQPHGRQPCWVVLHSCLSSCLGGWHPPTAMYARVHLFIRVWILGDFGVDIVFQTSPVVPLLPCQLWRLPQPRSFCREIPGRREWAHSLPFPVPSLRTGGCLPPVPHQGQGVPSRWDRMVEGGQWCPACRFRPERVGSALEVWDGLCSWVCGRPRPSPWSRPSPCRRLRLLVARGPPGRTVHAECHRHSLCLFPSGR